MGLTRKYKIGIVAPSSPTKERRIEKGVKKLNSFGHEVFLGKSVNQSYLGYLSGPDSLRSEDINEMYANDNIDMIICQNGGYGTPRIIDKLNYDLINNNPKILSGFSDITLLLNMVYMKTGQKTFHGPMLTVDFATERQSVHVDSFFDMLKNKEVVINQNNEYEIDVINEGVSEGVLVGGNLSLLSVFVGMEIDNYFTDKILLIEDVGEPNYRLDRMMQTLRLSGALDSLKGVIIGGISGETTPQEGSLDLFKNIFEDYKYPIIFNAPIGHVTPRYTVPIGGRIKLDANNKQIVILGDE